MFESMMPVADGKPMTQERLSQVFDLVKDPVNWKMPISTTVFKESASAQEIEQAIIWFTGSIPDLMDEGESYWVRASGYYESIGA